MRMGTSALPALGRSRPATRSLPLPVLTRLQSNLPAAYVICLREQQSLSWRPYEQTFLYLIFNCGGWVCPIVEAAKLGAAQRKNIKWGVGGKSSPQPSPSG